MTKKVSETVNLTIQEYVDVFTQPKREQLIDWTRVEDKLQNEMEWTRDGAAQIAALARDYGGFMLRNALALATVLCVEDGSLGL